MSKEKETLAISAMAEEIPQIKSALEEHGHRLGNNWIAPKAIASMAMMSNLVKNGVSFDKVTKTLAECLDAMQYIAVKQGKGADVLKEVPDPKTRLAAVKLFAQLMAIDKGFEIPPPEENLNASESVVRVKIRMNNDEPNSQPLESES